ncbi:MAG: peptidyl-prolyl cis-trans isomerase [Candidatus Sumerlaeia bacterium]|nr:peptidyl-prolyl cis-trans isomerase [Candidatus Sumerlaeia bacterium]
MSGESGKSKDAITTALQWATLAVCLATLVVALIAMQKKSDISERVDERIALAGALVNEGLPAEAIAEYTAAIELARGDAARKGNLAYLIGKTYFEVLKDYEKALAWFARAKHYNPNHPERARMEQWTVASLERLGRSLDARNRRVQATALRPSPSPTTGTVVARIGDEAITLADLEAAIRHLPPAMQSRLAEPKEKIQFLEEYVARRLLAEAAERADLQRDPKVLAELDLMRETLLANAYLEREVMAGATATADEAKAYYEAHRDEFPKVRRFELSHIELDNEAAATSASAALAGGADFADLARKVSVNQETRDKGGRLGGWIEGTPLPAPLGDSPEIASALASLKKGAHTGAIRTPAGRFQIVRVDDTSSPTVPAFEAVREQVLQRVRQEKILKKQEEVLTRLRNAEKVVIYREAIEGTKTVK